MLFGPKQRVHRGRIPDLLPREKGNQWRTNTIVETTHIYVDLFSHLYLNYLHIIWHLNVFILLEVSFLLLIVYLTFVYLLYLLWHC